MIFRNRLCLALCLSVFSAVFVVSINAQTRSRIVTPSESQPTNTQVSTDKVKRTVLSSPTTRPTLTNQIVVGQTRPTQPLVKKTSEVKMTTSAITPNSPLYYAPSLEQKMLGSIQSKLGIPYLMGTEGPNRYDCSGFVWSVFRDAGIYFERTSARAFWNEFEPVYGDDRFKFGTLVFFNKLGHVGIVADQNGFYQASSSKGITYSPFKGYWEKRIVGYRRIPVNTF